MAKNRRKKAANRVPFEIGKATIIGWSIVFALLAVSTLILAVLFALSIGMASLLFLIPMTLQLFGAVISLHIAQSTVAKLSELDYGYAELADLEQAIRELHLHHRGFWMFFFGSLLPGVILVSRIRKLILLNWKGEEAAKLGRIVVGVGMNMLGWALSVVVFGILCMPVHFVSEDIENEALHQSIISSSVPQEKSGENVAEELVREIRSEISFPHQTDDFLVLNDVIAEDNAVIFKYSAAFDDANFDLGDLQEAHLSSACADEELRMTLKEIKSISYEYRNTDTGKVHTATVSDAHCIVYGY